MEGKFDCAGEFSTYIRPTPTSMVVSFLLLPDRSGVGIGRELVDLDHRIVNNLL